MKKLIILCLSALFLISALSGCGEKIVKPNEPTTATSDTAQTPTAESDNYPTELSDSDISVFQNAFSSDENYGFLLSAYDDVREVDLNQVLYIGAGMRGPDNYGEIIDEYLALIGEPELFCDAAVLSKQQIDNFLLAKTGYTLSEMSGSFSWEYVPAYDAYVHQHGDTNYITATCTGGRAIGQDLYEIDYEFDGGIYDNDGNSFSGGTATVNTAGVSLQFISNSLR